MNYDKILQKLLIHNNRLYLHNYNRLIRNKKYVNIRNYLMNRYNDSNNIKESIYRIYFNIDTRPICPICGRLTNFDLKIENSCYTKYCSISCANKDPNVYNKQNETKLKKYGSKVNIEKRKSTNLIKYGVEEQSQRKEILYKQIQTKIKKYGSSNNSKKRWKTIKKDKVKYNEYINRITLFFNSEEFKQKEYDSKKKNCTFNTSKTEEQSYQLLKEKFSDVMRQYKSDEYPFCCDFYIPSINLYIECNFSWTHGGHSYDKDNEEDQLILEKWKEKNTKYYDNAINTWTIRDVRKRNIAKQNNLNYIEFWNLNELKNWLYSKKE